MVEERVYWERAKKERKLLCRSVRIGKEGEGLMHGEKNFKSKLQGEAKNTIFFVFKK